MNPTQICPTVGTNCRGLVTAVSIGEDTGFVDGAEVVLVVSSANKEEAILPRFRPPEHKTLLPACLIVLILRLQGGHNGYGARLGSCMNLRFD